MERDLTKLTSVKIIKKIILNSRKTTINTDLTLQKFVNRTIDLYMRDSDFREKVNSHETNGIKNSKVLINEEKENTVIV
jgi:hypothetical protein